MPQPQCWLSALAGILLIGGVGVSRVYLQVHYPSDVAAGFFLAAAWVGGVALVWHRVYR